MKMILTAEEMLSEWRLRRGIEPLRADSTVVRSDGMDFERLLQAEMTSWYVNLLDTAAEEMLSPENVAGETEMRSCDMAGGMTLRAPECVRRVLRVRMPGWEADAPVVSGDAAAAMLRRQANPFTAATPAAPVAVASGRDIMVFPADGQVVPADVTAVTDRSPGVYALDSRALELVTPHSGMLL